MSNHLERKLENIISYCKGSDRLIEGLIKRTEKLEEKLNDIDMANCKINYKIRPVNKQEMEELKQTLNDDYPLDGYGKHIEGHFNQAEFYLREMMEQMEERWLGNFKYLLKKIESLEEKLKQNRKEESTANEIPDGMINYKINYLAETINKLEENIEKCWKKIRAVSYKEYLETKGEHSTRVWEEDSQSLFNRSDWYIWTNFLEKTDQENTKIQRHIKTVEDKLEKAIVNMGKIFDNHRDCLQKIDEQIVKLIQANETVFSRLPKVTPADFMKTIK